jgi:putative membrane protein insertion efficiency factor
MRSVKKTARRSLVALWVAFLVADSFRAPANQMSATAYIGAVQVYQRYVRPLTSGFVHCRYRPTCSDYSIQAVQKHGTVVGLAMTAGRLLRCNPTVLAGTSDPVH